MNEHGTTSILLSVRSQSEKVRQNFGDSKMTGGIQGLGGQGGPGGKDE